MIILCKTSTKCLSTYGAQESVTSAERMDNSWQLYAKRKNM